MYVNIFNEKLYPYNLFSNSKEEFNINLLDYKNDLKKWSYDQITLKPVKKFLDNLGAEDYKFIYTTAISESWFDKGEFNFYLNGKHIKEYNDNTLKIGHFQGYIYICFKFDTPIRSLLVLRTNLPAAIEKFNSPINIENKGDILRLPYNNNFEYYPSSTNGVALTIRQKYIILSPGENIYDFIKNNKFPYDWLFNIKITSLLYLHNTNGLISNSDVLIGYPMWLEVKNNPDVKIIIFYDGVSPEEEIPNRKYKYLYEDLFRTLLKHDNLRNVVFNKKDKLFVQYDDIDIYNRIPEYSQKDEQVIIDEVLGLSYDLFMEGFRFNHSTKTLITRDDIEIVSSTKYSKNSLGEELIKITFRNYMNNPFEIYFYGILYQGTYLVDSSKQYTNIYINKKLLLDYYNIKEEDLDNIYGQVVKRSHSYKRINYSNLNSDYNGTLAISKDWFKLIGKRVLDNGFYLKENDYYLNSIYPSGLVCLFPRRKMRYHNVAITGYSNEVEITSNKYKVKIKNFTSDDLTKLRDPNKYIYKNLLFTDYIDYRFNLFIGPFLLTENIDYKILAPNLIEFLRPIGVYPGDEDKTHIDITIEYEGYVEEALLRIYKHKSFLYRFFNDDNVIEELYKIKEDTSLIVNRGDKVNCPERYPILPYRMNMMLTKYYSSEMVFGKDLEYGEAFYSLIKSEFPEFVTKIDNKYIIETTMDLKDVTDTPKINILPPYFNLNTLINGHILACKEMVWQNKHLNKEYEIDSDVLYRYNIPINMKGDFTLSSNIPINYIIDKDWIKLNNENFKTSFIKYYDKDTGKYSNIIE